MRCATRVPARTPISLCARVYVHVVVRVLSLAHLPALPNPLGREGVVLAKPQRPQCFRRIV